jgi:hypothetical protein
MKTIRNNIIGSHPYKIHKVFSENTYTTNDNY